MARPYDRRQMRRAVIREEVRLLIAETCEDVIEMAWMDHHLGLTGEEKFDEQGVQNWVRQMIPLAFPSPAMAV